MKKLMYLIVLTLILGLVLTGCSLLSNISQVPATGQSGVSYLTKGTLVIGNLVGLWHFNEGSGTNADDSSGKDNHGTISGASWVDGQSGFGKALSFDGADDYVNAGSDASFDFTDKFTVEAWVNGKVFQGGYYDLIVFRGYSNWAFGVYGANRLIFGETAWNSKWSRHIYSDTLSWTPGQWYHIAVVYDTVGKTADFYRDGVPVGVGKQSTDKFGITNLGDVTIGYPHSVSFNGLIDEVRIWSSVLDPSQLDDMLPPVVSSPNDDVTYLLNQAVSADWSAVDGTGSGPGSGVTAVASVVGSIIKGSALDTSTAGSYLFTVTATDYAKNEATKKVTYYVKYDFNDFLPPVSLGKPFKWGRTIPIKFQLTDAQGAFITNALPSISLKLISGGMPSGEVIDGDSSGEANTDSIFRYDPNSNQYIFNLATKSLTAPATYRITVDLGDGTTQKVDIGLK